MMNHRIHRQRWQIKASSPQTAFAIRQQLRDGLEGALLPVFERTFDAMAPDDEVIHIPRLTLDIQLSDADGDLVAALVQALPDKLHDTLREQLDEAMRHAAPPHPTSATERATSGPAQAQPGSTLASAEPEPPQALRLSAAARQRRALLHYLTTGLLEWHEQHEADILLMLREAAAAQAETLADDPAALRDVLFGTPAQRHAAAFRLLHLLPETARTGLLARLAPAVLPSDVTDLAGALQLLAETIPTNSPLLLRVQAMLLAIRQDAALTGDPQLAALLRDCLPHVPSGSDSPELMARIAALLREHEARPNIAAPHFIQAPDAPAARQPEAASGAEYLTGDAGLILLHPFLPRMFAELGVTDGDTLLESQLPRAAALLHDLVYGSDDLQEYQLPLVKVLLGLTPDHPLPVCAGLLDQADRDEARALLNAAITHWNALGNTGPDALRASFLQRRGLLRDTDSGWQLQVEPAPYDLLLGRLPWSFSIVRLPWMTRPLHTEWVMP